MSGLLAGDKYTNAAQSLIIQFNQPAQFHAVWVNANVDAETGDIDRTICVSIRPGHEKNFIIPAEHEGVPVRSVPWPE